MSWADIKGDTLRESIFSSFLFSIYINNLPNGLNSDARIFADDKSLFFVINITESANLFKSNLSKRIGSTMETTFNPDPKKQAQDIIRGHKTSKRNQPGLMFNNNIVNLTNTRKHLAIILDLKLSFGKHLKSVLSKLSKTIGLLQWFQGVLPRICFLTIYKPFTRSHLDQTFNESFH